MSSPAYVKISVGTAGNCSVIWAVIARVKELKLKRVKTTGFCFQMLACFIYSTFISKYVPI